MAATLQISEVDLSEPLLDCETRLRNELRRQYLDLALRRVWGSISDTARVLGVSRRSVIQWVRDLEIDVMTYYPPERRERLAEQRKLAQQRAIELLNGVKV